MSKLHNLLRPFLLRRLKSDVESSLPAKAEIVLYSHMSADQKRLNEQLCDRTVNVRPAPLSRILSTCPRTMCHINLLEEDPKNVHAWEQSGHLRRCYI